MKIARPKSLKDLVVEELRNRIVDNRLRLGAALSENTLAAELGISKTPVREALLQLKLEGLVEVQPQRGTYVFRLDPQQVVLISELREVLEIAAAGAAIERNGPALFANMGKILEEMRAAYEAGDTVSYHVLDGRYHQAIVDLCGNPYIVDAYSQIGFRIQALRSRLSNEAVLNSRSMKDHVKMLELVRKGDAPGLQALLRTHVAHTRDWFLDVLAEPEAATKELAS
jgi:DNA-binding GntR family transcriptional regulator